jgi:hypothetical protein
MTVLAVPDGMRILDGIPVPVSVNGVAVESVRRAADEGVHWGRTHLVLANMDTTQGCVDCVYTHKHWQLIAKHRHQAHGAQVAWRNRWNSPNGHTQLELTEKANDEPIVVDVEPPSEPAAEPPRRILQWTSELIAAIGPMTIDEVLTTAASSYAAGKRIEDITADRDYWRAKYKALEREVRSAARLLGKASDTLSKKGED